MKTRPYPARQDPERSLRSDSCSVPAPPAPSLASSPDPCHIGNDVADGFETVRELLARGELVAFVGAGLSKPGGMPLWPELVQAIRSEAVHAGVPADELADIDRAIGSGLLIDALTELERHLGPTSFARAVAALLDDRSGPDGRPRLVPDVVQALAELAPGLRAVITTNLDAFIHRAFPREWQSFDRLTADLASRHRYIFRLHGAVHDRSTWVLTRSEYDRVMEREPLYHAYFSAVFLTQPMLFVGFGLADPHFDRIAQKIRALAQGQPPHHFALVPQAQITPAQRRKLGESGIELLGYPSYDALPALLRSLASRASAMSNTTSDAGMMPVPSSLPSGPFPGAPAGATPPGAPSPAPAASAPAPPRPHIHGVRAQPSKHSAATAIAIVGSLALLTILAVVLVTKPWESSHLDAALEPVSTLVSAKSRDHGNTEPLASAPTSKQMPQPYPSLPTVDAPSGPISSDARWSAALLDSLNSIEIRWLSSEQTSATFKFQLTVCKDGSIKTITKKGGAMSEEQQTMVRLALEKHRLPKPPPSIASTMVSPCAKIKYTFILDGSGVR